MAIIISNEHQHGSPFDTRVCEVCRAHSSAPCAACDDTGRVPNVAPPPEPMTAIDFETRIGSLLSEVLNALTACTGPCTGLCLEVHFWRKREARRVYRDLQKRGFTVGFCAAPYGGRSRGATVRIWQ